MKDLAVYETFAVADMRTMADAMGKSGMFGKSPEQLFSLMLIAQAEGKHPAIAAQEWDIIQGKPALNSRSALARFQNAGGKINWLGRTDTKATAVFSHPSGGELTVSWDMKRAQQAQLSGKDNWKKYPAQMLSARVIAEGVRAVLPACLSGFYLNEEVQDFDKPKSAPRNVTESAPVEVVPDIIGSAVDNGSEPAAPQKSGDTENIDYEATIAEAVKSGKLSSSDASIWIGRLSKPATQKGAEDWIRANLEPVGEARIVNELDSAAEEAFAASASPGDGIF